MTGAGWAAAERGTVAHLFVASLDDRCTVDGPDGHHLQRVRRLRPGEEVTAADGTGRWRRYVVADVPPGRVVLDARAEVRAEPEVRPALALALALTKQGLDAVVAGCTELGVVRFEPVRAARSVVRWDDRRAQAAVARLRVIAREAAAQCRRARVPEVAPVADLADLAARRDLVVADREGVTASALAEPASGTWTVLVGPEGGLDAHEREVIGDRPRLAVGRHVLRAQTAPVAVAAALAERARERPP
ncbi:MAG: hypothetical protein KatS3mg009_2932 [Acidimicrobiia bacterium]|nr:MAG: hypothetical protein KatS3mg009_2932 [Acidimicrobiia bacterium]